MTNQSTLLDPTAEHTPSQRARAPRPFSLQGLTIGLLDISKPRGDVFLDQIEAQLLERGLSVRRFQKPTHARVAPLELRQAISTQCQVVIEALAD
jgi:hypothetical protein